jgi:hypothetical protein
VRRDHLEHVIRSAARIARDPDVLVIGSQSVLGSFDDDRLPLAATTSIEADIAFMDDPDDAKADRVDGAIGELSRFHESFGYYAQGVSVTTATLPEDWQRRLVVLATPATDPGRGLCLEPHDCVISKLVAGRPKDLDFAAALIGDRLVLRDVLLERLTALAQIPQPTYQRILTWLQSPRSGG